LPVSNSSLTDLKCLPILSHNTLGMCIRGGLSKRKGYAMKVRFGVLWVILTVALLLGFPVLFYSTVPGTYTPPAPGTTAAQVPPRLAVKQTKGAIESDLTTPGGITGGGQSESPVSAGEQWIDSQIASFY